MRSGVFYSVALHGAVVLAAAIGLPQWSKAPVATNQPIPVEVVRFDELTNPPKGRQPEPEVEKEAEADESTTRRRAADGGSEAPEEKAEVEPKPEEKPEPEPEPKTAKPEPEKAPEPEVAEKTPEPEPEEKAAPEEPAPKPEEKPEAEQRAKAEPEAKPEPEKKPEPEPKVEKKPEPKPEPKPKAEKKPEPEKKVEKKPEPKPKAEPKPKPKPKPEPRRDQARKKAEKDGLSSVFDTVDSMRKSGREAERDQAARPEPRGSRDNVRSAPLSISDIDAIRRQIQPCWNFDGGMRDARTLRVLVEVHLHRDGSVARAEVVDQGRMRSDAYFRAAAEAGLRAVLNPRCSPLRLPPERYDRWRVIRIDFDPSKINN